MEAWFLADRDALTEFYGPEFLEGSLPAQPNIEQIPKASLIPRLKLASKQTSKGPYHKTRHGFALLARVNPQRLREASPHASRLFEVLIHETNA
jgi:hypothetical protein